MAQRVGSFVEGIKSRSHLPTDEELEAEAQRERDRSRREAEAILTREAEQRRLVEERVLAMMDSTKSLPPPPSRTATMSNPPSPSSSHKEKDNVSWWTAAKNRLTPTKDKESLTPAQQVIQDAKAREKEQRKSGKGKEKAAEWPPQSKQADLALNNLNIPPVSPQRKPVPGSPVSPTPSRPSISNMAPNLSPSPMRSVDNLSTSPSREAPPLYAQFNGQGALDLPGTLLVIARRFEKLEKWTVGHVRALEERMNDVERWLVDKEKERERKEKTGRDSQGKTSPSLVRSEVQQELSEIREEIGELQGRVGELGREMAKMVTAPSNLSSGPSRQSPVINAASPTNSMIATHHSPSASTSSTPHHSRLVSVTARESTSPPMASSSKASGTRLPYPTGDYALPHSSFSPPSSPPAAKTRHMSIPGLPSNVGPTTTTTAVYPNALSGPSTIRTVSPAPSLANINHAASPSASITSFTRSNAPSPNLPPPKSQKRQSSVSPTPRKRYTVALGEPIRSQSPPVREEETTPLSSNKRNGTPISFNKPQTSIGTAMFSPSPVGVESGNGDEDGFQDETIGKSAAARLVNASGGSSDNGDIFTLGRADYKHDDTSGLSTRPPRRPRPQSTYVYGTSNNLEPPQASIQPLKPRVRSKSTDRFGSMESLSSVSSVSSSTSGRFIDPLLLRNQEREKERGRNKGTVPNPKGKVAVGQLVAFFDGEKKEKS